MQPCKSNCFKLLRDHPYGAERANFAFVALALNGNLVAASRLGQAADYSVFKHLPASLIHVAG
jgi:hypothetical protein